jgi:long-subunit acyl-CoA synthetase (AMP-forming)
VITLRFRAPLETLTNEVLIDGYFHTGDIGTLDKALLKDHGSKKMFKTSGGKYIAPQLIHNENNPVLLNRLSS